MRASCDIDRIILQTKNEKQRKKYIFKKENTMLRKYRGERRGSACVLEMCDPLVEREGHLVPYFCADEVSELY